MKKLLVLLLLVSCGPDPVFYPTESEQTVIEKEKIVYKEPPYDAVGDIIYNENNYRDLIGQLPLTEGLTCTLYTVPNTTTQIAGAVLTSKGSFTYKEQFEVPNSSVNDGLPVLPDALKVNYKTWYILRCSGQIVITEDGYHNFELTSDDGSVLYLGGSALINHDGLHGTSSKSGVKFIRKGITAFRIDYLQSSGSQSLIIKMNDQVISKKLFWK